MYHVLYWGWVGGKNSPRQEQNPPGWDKWDHIGSLTNPGGHTSMGGGMFVVCMTMCCVAIAPVGAICGIPR